MKSDVDSFFIRTNNKFYRIKSRNFDTVKCFTIKISIRITKELFYETFFHFIDLASIDYAA